MVAVDTNVVVRLLTGDDPEQSAEARRVFESDEVWLTKTVLLEVEWVLRSLYGYDAAAIREALTKLLGLPGATVEGEPEVAAALELTRHGIQFADALHLCSRPSGAQFMSFDRALVQRAKRAGVTGVVRLAGRE